MRRWWKLGPLAVAVGVAAGLALLLGTSGLVFSEGEQGVVSATVKVNPLQVTLLVPTEPISVGEAFTVQATVENQGESRIRRVTATLHVPDGLDVRGPDTRRLRPLEPLGSRSTEWQLTATQPVGFVLMVTAEGVDASDRVTVSAESGANVITVK